MLPLVVDSADAAVLPSSAWVTRRARALASAAGPVRWFILDQCPLHTPAIHRPMSLQSILSGFRGSGFAAPAGGIGDGASQDPTAWHSARRRAGVERQPQRRRLAEATTRRGGCGN